MPEKAMDRLDAEVARLREQYEVSKAKLAADERLKALEKLLVSKLDIITDEVRVLREKSCAVTDCPHRKTCQ
jgi:hypothetical protein